MRLASRLPAAPARPASARPSWAACGAGAGTSWEPCDPTEAVDLGETILDLEPWGYWRLSETGPGLAADSSGNGRNGTYGQVAAYGLPGVAAGDTAIRGMGDTTSTAVLLPAGISAALRTSFTMAFWASPTRVVVVPAVIGGQANSMFNQDGEYIVRPDHGGFNSTQVGVGVSFGTNALLVVPHSDNVMPCATLVETTFSPASYYFVVVVAERCFERGPSFVGSHYRVYVNGRYGADFISDQGSGRYVESHNGPNQVSFASANIGSPFYGHGFGGRMDEWAYFDRALTPEEIASVYHVQQDLQPDDYHWSENAGGAETTWTEG